MTALLANTPTQVELLLHSLERTAGDIALHINADKTEYICFNKKGDLSTLDGCSLKSVDKFMNLGSSVSSNENDINIWLAKACSAIDRLSIIRKSDLSDKIKRNFIQALVVLILLYVCTTETLTKRIVKR